MVDTYANLYDLLTVRNMVTDDIVSKCLAHPPVDTKYVAGLWHHGRLSPQGFLTEARVHAAAAVKPKNRDVRKFLIICRARSGSTLLTKLLDAHPEITCQREMLGRNVVAPQLFLKCLAQKAETPVYGCKLLSYQMIQVHRFKDPERFLANVVKDGYRLIHLVRDTFPQALSLYMAQTRKVFHRIDGDNTSFKHGKNEPKASTVLDIDDFVRRLEWADMLMQYERYIIRNLPHETIYYENDLDDVESQKQTASRLFNWLGVSSFDPPIPMQKVLSKDVRETIENYDSLARSMEAKGLGRFLPP